jgi:tetratricopeptide (TPR) repeat protein
VATRQDFGRELTLAKDRAGQTIRALSKRVNVPVSTLGGYFAGTHLPAVEPPGLLDGILRGCGIADPAELSRWQAAYWRAKRPLTFRGPQPDGPQPRPSAPAPAAEPRTEAEFTQAEGRETRPHYRSILSLHPPLDRLEHEPGLRGRESLLEVLRGALASSGNADRPRPDVHVLHGLGGSGKSRLALTLAAESVAAGVRTWWMTSDRSDALNSGMRALAAELGVPTALLQAGNLPDLLWHRLGRLESPWLLVLDDVDDPRGVLALPTGSVADGTGWLRSASGGHVLVTTRDGTDSTWATPEPSWLRRYHVEALSPSDGAGILIELAGQDAGSTAEAEAVASRLGGLPLALNLAGRCLARAREMPPQMAAVDGVVTFPSYEFALGRGDLSLLAPDPAGLGVAENRRSHAVLERTWEISLDLLGSRGLQLARPLLYALACLGPAPVPYGMLLGNRALERSALFGGVTMSEVWNVLRELTGFSLIDRFKDQASDVDLLTIHPLVREISRLAAERGGAAHLYLDVVTDMLREALRTADPAQPSQWTVWRLLADHCLAPLGMIERSGQPWSRAHAVALELAGQAADYLRAAGYWDAAETTYRRALGAAGRMPVEATAQVLELRHGLARVHYDKGLLAEAEQEFRGVLAERTAQLGAADPATLTTQHYLVRTLRGRRAFAEAVAMCTATLNARRTILGELHPDTLTSRNGMADLLRETGRTKEAKALYEIVLAQRSDVLGERHPATLVTSHYLAMTDHDLDNLDVAEEKFRELATANAEVRGSEHPRTLSVRQSLIDVLHDLGRLDEAERLARDLLETRCRNLGPTHPAALTTRHRLGLVLLDQGVTEAALAELRTVLEHRRRVLGPRHPDTVLVEKDAAALSHRLNSRDG